MMEKFERDHPTLDFGEKFRVLGRDLIRMGFEHQDEDQKSQEKVMNEDENRN